ncbi:carbohydrate-binding protein [Streptomyces roseifaciens]
MGIYQVDLYAKTVYGAPLYVAFDASPMRAEQRGYGALEVTWQTPLQAGASQILAGVKAWSRLRLVRNSYGVPDTEDDGWVILDMPAGTGSGGGQPANTYLDDTVVPGQLYYYAVFVASTVDTYQPQQTYQPGDVVIYSGANYQCLAPNTTGVTPGTNPAVWAPTPITEPWYRAGGCAGLAVREYGYSPMLYDYIPRPYKVAFVETTASEVPVNDHLWRLCQIFGYFFDVIKSEHVQLLRMQNVLRCTDRQISLLAQQMGILDRMPSLPELRRTYVRDAALIQRNRGSIDSTRRLVKAATGWDADILIGYNRLLNNDDASFQSPTFPVWQRDVVYFGTKGSTRYSPSVMYGDKLYTAIAAPLRYAATLLYTSTNPARTGSGTIRQEPDILADPFPGYVRLAGADTTSTLTWKFAAPGTAKARFSVLLVCMGDPKGGTVSVTVNGQPTTLTAAAPLDLYSRSRQPLPIVSLGTFELDVTETNTLALSVVGKNPLSGGSDITTYYWLVQGSPINLNRNPETDPAARTYWTAPVAPGTYRDTATELNPLTNGFGSWNVQFPGPSINPVSPTTGEPQNWWINIMGAAAGAASPGPGNSLAYTPPTAGTGIEVYQGGNVPAPTWSPEATYFPGQAVTYPAADTAYIKRTVYVARVQSTGDRPDLSPTQWEPTSYRLDRSKPFGVDTPEPAVLLSSVIPIRWQPEWTATKDYRGGEIVSWRGHLYEAARPSFAIYPPGAQRDNLWWRWIGIDTQTFTYSLFHNRDATGAGQDVRLWVRWYDEAGTFLSIGYIGTSSQILFDRFEVEGTTFPPAAAIPSPTPSPPAGYVKPASGQQGVPVPWNWSRGAWSTREQTVYPTTWDSADANLRKAGRVLWFDRRWVYDDGTLTGWDVYATFLSKPEAAGMEHGIMFRFGNASATAGSYWLASRERLTYTALAYDSSGAVTGVTVTPKGTWTQGGQPYALQDGDRIRVRTFTDGRVWVQAAGLGAGNTWLDLITPFTDTTAAAQSGYGLLERSTA